MGKWIVSQQLLKRSSTSCFGRRFLLSSLNSTPISASSGSIYKWKDPCVPSITPSLDRQQKKYPQTYNSLSSEYAEICHASATRLNGTYGLQYRHFGSASTKIQRNPLFATITSDDISHFKELLGEKNVIQDKDRLLTANMDWMRKYEGSSQLLLQPRSTDEVSQILKYCNSRRLAVVPQGGNTGLVGGSVPVFDEVIVNIGSMNNIISLDKVSGILVCEAGCILENLDSFLANQGFIMPLDLGAKGSCQIGGNVSTNAGGLRFIRYGSLHGSVLGLEAVLANGSVLDMLGTLRKDNTGYDLKHLFIGSEGTLGIVTKISILTPPRLSSVNLAFLACKDYLSCQKLLQEAKRTLGVVLSAFEFLDSYSMDMVLTHLEGVRNPLPRSTYNFYVLIETTGSSESYDKNDAQLMAMVTGDHEAVWLQLLTNIMEGDSAVAIMQLLGLHTELRLLRELLVLLRDSMIYPMTMKFLLWMS